MKLSRMLFISSPTWHSLVASASRNGVNHAFLATDAAIAEKVPACRTVEQLVQWNQQGRREFAAEPAYSARRRYLAMHPTQIVVFKCMDGRLNVSNMTQMPCGILTPFRNIGGRFDLGWPLLKEAVKSVAHFAESQGSRTLVMSMYHFSKGDPCRGCKGMNFDTEASKREATRFHDQLNFAFSPSPAASVVPIVVGIETDDEALIFHGEADGGSFTGNVLNVADFASSQPDIDALRHALESLYPSMDRRLLKDLLPLLEGNAKHIHEVRTQHEQLLRTIVDFDHREIVIGVGRGFDWLHVPNKALLIGPFEHNWVDHVVTAARVILSNIQDRQSANANDGVVILSSSVCYAPQGCAEWNMAVEQSLYLAKISMEAVAAHVPDLLKATKLHVMPVVVSGHTMEMFPIC